MIRKPVLGPERHTNPLIWCFAVICTAIAVAVIITGIVVFVGYLIIRPKVPFISVAGSHLDKLYYDQGGLLTTQITIVVRAENDNAKAHARFYDASFLLSFRGLEIAKLVANPFDVGKNSSVDFNYVVESSPIPLKPEEMETVDMSLKQNRISFALKGNARTRWRVGILGSVKFWCHLNCQLQFNPSNGSSIYSHCSSRSK